MGLAIKIKVALFDGFFFLQHFFCYFSNSGEKHTILNGIAFGAFGRGIVRVSPFLC